MNKFDPNEVFINNFGRRIKGTGTTVDTDPLAVRCALLDNCFCSNNSDCGRTQTCTTIPGYNYNVCKTMSEAPLVFNRASLPPPLGIVSFLAADVPTLAVAVLGNCTIGALGNTLRSIGGNVLGTLLSGLNGTVGWFLRLIMGVLF